MTDDLIDPTIVIQPDVEPRSAELDRSRLGSQRGHGEITIELTTKNAGDHGESIAAILDALAVIQIITLDGVEFSLSEGFTTSTTLDNHPF